MQGAGLWQRKGLALSGGRRSLMGFNLIYLFEQVPAFRELANELLDLDLPPPKVAAEFGFDDAQAAIRYLQAGQATGKVILTLNQE